MPLPYLGATLDQLQSPVKRYILGGEHAGWESYEAAVAPMPTTPIADQRAGTDMLYSSGTTGQPKGVRFPLPEDPDIAGANALSGLAMMAFKFSGAASICHQRRSITPRLCAGASLFTGSAAPWS